MFKFKTVTFGETLVAINQLGNSAVFSHNYIDATALKVAMDILAEPITHLANISIESSTFTKSWRKAKLIPIHKGKGTSQTNPGSYRPVAILPTILKIIEKVSHIQIVKFMESSSQFNHNLHGYRSSYSTTTALLQLSDTILQATDANLVSTLVTVDERAVFDCVNFYILLSILKLYNFGPKAREWVVNYIKDRIHYVKIGAKQSETMSVGCGVPQGSVLGPLFYTIYTNELPQFVIDKECENPAHRKNDTLFGDNCRKCGSIPSLSDNATYIVETKTREASQQKVDNATGKIKNFLNSQEPVVNMSKTTPLESMVKQKCSHMKGDQPSLTTWTETGEE